MSKRKRRSFTPEFKAETVRVIRESGKSIGVVSRELGLTETSVRHWVEAEAAAPRRGSISTVGMTEREELERLRREVKRLRMERDILKKATAFFAKESE